MERKKDENWTWRRQIFLLNFTFKGTNPSNFFNMFFTEKGINTFHSTLVNFSQSLLSCGHFAIFLLMKIREKNHYKCNTYKSHMQIRQDHAGLNHASWVILYNSSNFCSEFIPETKYVNRQEIKLLPSKEWNVTTDGLLAGRKFWRVY